MNRKRNGWASLVALLLLLAVLAMILLGCDQQEETQAEPEYRFSKEEVYSDMYDSFYLLTDKETGEQWIVYSGIKRGGITKYDGE